MQRTDLALALAALWLGRLCNRMDFAAAIILDKNGNPTAKNDFITTKIINSYLGMLAAKKAAQEKYDKVIEEIKESIEFITDAKSANEFAAQINEFEHVGSSLMMARSLFAAKVKALGLIFNKETKIYSDAA